MKNAKWLVISAGVIGLCVYLGQRSSRASENAPARRTVSAPVTTQGSDSKSTDVVGPTTKPQTRPANPQKPKVYTRKIAEGQLIADFGVKTGKPVDRGFVFFDGRYIEAPYVVMRIGIAIYINKQEVHRQ